MVARFGGVLKGNVAASGGGSSATASITGAFLTYDYATNNATDYTFSGLSFGTAAANRLIIVAVGSRDGHGSGSLPDSVTIGGVSGTQRASQTSVAVGASLWQALVPSGTSGTVDVSFASGNGQLRCAIGLWSVKTNSQTPTNTGQAPTNTISATCPANGYGIVGYFVDAVGSPTQAITPNGYTEDFETANFESGSDMEGGHFTASATLNPTGADSSSGDVIVYAAWSA